MSEKTSQRLEKSSRVAYEETLLKRRMGVNRHLLYLDVLSEACHAGMLEGEERKIPDEVKLGLMDYVRGLSEEDFTEVSAEVKAKKDVRVSRSKQVLKPHGFDREQIKNMRTRWDEYVEKGGRPPLAGAVDD